MLQELHIHIIRINITINVLQSDLFKAGIHHQVRRRDSSVGIATCYGLESPEIESRWGEIFRTYPDRLRGPPSHLYNGYRVFPGVRCCRGVTLTPSPPFSAEVKIE